RRCDSPAGHHAGEQQQRYTQGRVMRHGLTPHSEMPSRYCPVANAPSATWQGLMHWCGVVADSAQHGSD
ncbi:MAG: hypothetical protein ABIU96_01930, partial [Rhodanobacter sp.]